MSPLDDAVKEIVLKAVDVFFKTNEEGTDVKEDA